jgi:copper chaperone NosL
MTPLSHSVAPPAGGATASSLAATTRRRDTIAKSSRWLVVGAALCLLVTYVAPLWRIALEAPQYPEGLGLEIWSSRITGDLRSINGLNHYIGMKEIHPDAIPELRFMPVALPLLMTLGLLAAAWGRRAGLYAWTGLMVAGSLAGLIDFWKWGYDYGHNLDPTAAIQVPGMSYQPPLIGAKQLLNFQATSWPGVAGWVALAGLVIAVGVSLIEWRRSRRHR